MEQFIKRLKSFIWRFGVALITFGLAWLADNIGLLELPLWVTMGISYGINEVTKWWNNRMTLKGKTFLGRAKRDNVL